MPIKDSLIAATALAHDLTVVTLNRRDFDAAGVSIVDPKEGDLRGRRRTG
jgi:predicted nucleic acid-binding protein